jgi:hypothetical protein
MQFILVGGGAGVGAGLTGSRHLSHDSGHASRTILPLRKVLQYSFCRPCATQAHPDKPGEIEKDELEKILNECHK